ncbi:hydrogenase maturation nickel metallochaperone HypA [Roseospirillum parvum]|uniref:Hydrogenase maturation factor HypA n=1 Tax=Roseospirillum parvum TaxID=83401 RepID=A0A1G8B1Y8_9PROT|nr:hydrogenase maturation nickel metallochaperone HypA [Roseospirillum parvum]SDH27043.1 hydrogenase nickel incorporation protein HypA/HybF [Roseospirillum parvum]
MHELSLAQGIRRILEDEAKSQGFEKVTAVWLDIGALSHADPEALEFCFAASMAGSLAEGAALHIARTPGRAWCWSCAKEVPLARRIDPCPDCGGHRLEVVGGDDMRVRELEVS